MASELYEAVKEGLEEILDVVQGNREFAKETLYQDFIRIEVKEHGKTVWTLRKAMKTLRATDLSGYEKPAELLQAVRKILGQSQSGMAAILGIPKATYQNWEHGRVQPRGPSKSLIRMAISNPYELMKASTSKNELVAL